MRPSWTKDEERYEAWQAMSMEKQTRQKVILIYPRLPERLPALSFPVGPLYVGSYLVNHGYEVTILDANNFRHDKDFLDALDDVLSPALAVGLSVMTAQLPSALEISRYIMQRDSSIHIIWGGVHPSLFPEQTAKCKYVDFAVRDEGEITLLELLKALEGQKEPSKVKGISFKSDNHEQVITTEVRPFTDLNKLPPVKWELLENIRPGSKLKLSEIAQLTGRGVYLQTGRGCPHRCTFCINSVLKNRYRDKRSDLVLREIKQLLDLGVDRIWFTDENFFTSKERIREIIDGIEREGFTFKWYATMRANYLNPHYIDFDLAARLKQNGCEMLAIGAESGSPRILRLLKKDITIEQTLDAARFLHKVGLKASFSFMTGLPGEEKEDIFKTLRLIAEIAEIDDSFSFRILGPQVYRPYPGSELYLKCLKLGMKEPIAVEEWAKSPYIRSETIIDPMAYPWIKHDSRFINNVVFYGNLQGVRLRFRFITGRARKVAALRCRKLYFKFPIEKLAYNLLMKTGAYKILRIKRILGE